jgi:hypothetical protein
VGIQIDPNVPFTPEIKQYLNDRGRGHQVVVNERRFGVDGTEAAEHEIPGAPASNQFYDTDLRNNAVYDVGGGKLPGTVLDYDTGRTFDRENGVTVEFNGSMHAPGQNAHDTTVAREEGGFTSYEVDENGNPIKEIDEDIQEYVQSIKTVKDLKTKLDEAGIEYDKEDKRDDLEILLAVHLDDERLAGNEVDLT